MRYLTFFIVMFMAATDAPAQEETLFKEENETSGFGGPVVQYTCKLGILEIRNPADPEIEEGLKSVEKTKLATQASELPVRSIGVAGAVRQPATFGL